MLERNNAVIKLSRRKSDFCPFCVFKCIGVLVYLFKRFHSTPFNIQPVSFYVTNIFLGRFVPPIHKMTEKMFEPGAIQKPDLQSIVIVPKYIIFVVWLIMRRYVCRCKCT